MSMRSRLRLLVVAGVFSFGHGAMGQQEIPLYPETVPGSESRTQQETISPAPWNPNVKLVRNVAKPTLTVFLPKAPATGTAVIVAPGGGFRFLSWDYEGTDVARWLADRGITAFVLKYRVMDTGATEEDFKKSLAELDGSIAASRAAGGNSKPDPQMLKATALAAEDARQAVKLVRERAAQWGIGPDRIGLMGFSAGAAATDAVLLEHSAENRPDFGAPIYGAPVGDLAVPADAPPVFLACADDDNMVSATGSVRMYVAWRRAGKPAELHIYAKGGHGFGMTKKNIPTDGWIEQFYEWLKVEGLAAGALRDGGLR